MKHQPEITVAVKLNDAEFSTLESLAKEVGHKPGPHLTFRTKKFLAKVASNRKGKKS